MIKNNYNKEEEIIENKEKTIYTKYGNYEGYKTTLQNPPVVLKDYLNFAQAFIPVSAKIHHEHDKIVKKILEKNTITKDK